MLAAIVLGLHITIAFASLIIVLKSSIETFQKNIDRASNDLRLGWIGTFLTISSGIVLTLVSQISFGRLCISLFSFLVAMVMAQAYYSLTSYKLQKTKA